MFKIMYVVSTLKKTGPTRQLFNIVKSLDRTKFSPVIVTLSPEPKESLIDLFLLEGLEVIPLNLSRLKGIFYCKRRLEELIDEVSPQLIHSQGIRADVLGSFFKNKCKTVATCRNFVLADYRMTYGSVQGYLMSIIHSLSFRSIDRVVGVSESVSKNLKEKYNLAHVVTIHNGVCRTEFSPTSSESIRRMRSELGFCNQSKIWISSGHLSKRKNPAFLIKNWGYVFGNNPTHHLVFVGDGDLRGECENLTKHFSNIHLMGRVSNVADYLKISDYYISASLAEGLPNSVLEALSCELPVLLSDIEPHREFFITSSPIGYLYKSGNSEHFLSALNKLSEESLVKKKTACRLLIDENFSSHVMSKKYQKVYEELAGE